MARTVTCGAPHNMAQESAEQIRTHFAYPTIYTKDARERQNAQTNSTAGFHACQNHLRRMIAAHSVDPSARGRRGGTKINPVERRAIHRSRRSQKKLRKRGCAARNIASDQVSVVPLKVRWREDATRQNLRPE